MSFAKDLSEIVPELKAVDNDIWLSLKIHSVSEEALVWFSCAHNEGVIKVCKLNYLGTQP